MNMNPDYDIWDTYFELQKAAKEKKIPKGKLIRMSPPMPIAGYLKVIFEDGSIKMSPVRTDSRIISMEFEPVRDSSPWDYENDPDDDGVFKPIAPDSRADKKG